MRFTLALALCLPSLAFAAQTVRYSVDQRGDVTLIGNSGSYDCGNGPIAPVVGTVGACGTNTGDTSGDVLWRSDSPAVNQAEANNGITVANARTTAQLVLPVGATITYARLYWSAKTGGTTIDTDVVLDRQGGFTAAVTADVTYPSVNSSYQASADVTTLLQANGEGAYRVGGINMLNPVNQNDSTFYVGWSMVVIYRLDSLPPRNITLFDGFDLVNTTQSANVTLSGFVVPDAGFDGKLGIIAYEGDPGLTGETFTFGGVAASDALNPNNNALNGTRTYLGAAVSNAGDLPRLTGAQGSVTGMDLDIFNVTAALSPNQTSANLSATSTGDVFIHGAFITSVSTLKPIFVDVQKTVTDLNGGDVVPGDVLEYVATGTNSGTDTAIGLVLTDALPAGMTFVPGSINLVSGGVTGLKTDATGDDQGDYNAGSRTVTVRLGTGANATTGGSLPVGGSFEVRLRVTVDPGAPGTINNQVDLSVQGSVGLSLGLTTPIVYQSDNAGTGLRRPTPITIQGDTTIVTGPPLITNAATATFTFASNISGATFECSLDGAPFVACPTPSTFVALTEASHTLQVRYRSGATVDATPASYTWVVDRTAPVAPVVQTPADNTFITNRRPVISGTAEAGSTVRVFIDGVQIGTTVATAGGTFSFTPTSDLATGLRQVRVTATDPAGNTSPNSNTNTFTIDLTAPDTAIVTGPPVNSNSTSATFTFSATEAVQRYECSLDGAAFTTCTTPQTFTGLAAGPHSLAVRAVDLAGNTDATPATATWTIDLTAPAAPVVSAPANGSSTNNNRPPITGSAEANSTVTVFIDGVAVGTTTATAGGTFSFTPTSNLSQASHTVRVTATDASGNVSPTSNTNTFTVDTTAPSAPVVSAPANGSRTNNTQPPVTGTAEANSTVTVFLDGVSVGTTTATAGGTFSFTPPTALTQGSHTVRVTARDAAGNTSPNSNTNTFTVDTTPPAAPVVTAPSNGSATTNTRPAITGTAEANSTVTVSIDGAVVGTTTATAGGGWTFTPPTALADGSHTVNATATDVAGNTGPVSNTNTFTVDTTAPAAPVVSAPADGSATNTNRPAITGTAEAGSTVTIFIDGVSAGTTTATAGGTFSFTPTTNLAQGSHTARVTATDAAGNTSPSSNTNTFTVDTAAPAAPVVSAPADGAFIATRTPTITGTAEANSTVTVFIDGVSVGTTTTSASGAWSFATTASLADGPHTVRATATDAAGNTSAPSSTNTFTVQGGPPETTLVSGPTGTVSSTTATFVVSSEPGATFECNLDGAGFTACPATSSYMGLSDGPHTLEIRALNGAGTPDPTPVSQTWTVDSSVPDTTITVQPPALTSSTTARFEFTATKADATFECSLDSGAWVACTSPFVTAGTLADGVHVLLVRAIDGAGRTDATPARATWQVDTTAPNAPVITEPVAGATTGPLPNFGGLGEPGSTVTITINGQPVCSGVAAADGRWTCAATTPLPAGPQTATATAKDPAGNTSMPSMPRPFVVDASTPDTVILTGPSGLTNQSMAAFTVTSNRTGATYECSLDGAAFMPCSASPSFTGLMDGLHTLEVRAVENGMTDPTPASRMWTQDTTPPVTPGITSPAPNGTTSPTPTFTGTGEPGSTIVVRVDGQPVCTTTADATGAFSCAGPGTLTPGPHTVTATSTDPAGNSSPPSTTVDFTVAAGALDTAIIAGPSGTVSSTSATFSFVATVVGATYECSLDGAAFTPCTTPVTFSSLSDGSHTLEVRAVDGATVDSTPASRTWVIDSSAPMAPVISTPADMSTVTTRLPTFSGTAEPGSTVRVSVDDALVCTAVANASGAWSCTPMAPLTDGAHRVSAVAKDAAGNLSPVSMTNLFTVSVPAVTVAITLPVNDALTNDATPDLAGTATPGSTVTISIDGLVVGTALADANGRWTFTPTTALTDGSHVITATAALAGTTSPVSNQVTVRIDTTPPTVTVVVTKDPNGFPVITITPGEMPVTTTCSLDGGGFGPCTNPLDITGLSPGTHTLVTRVTDSAGNVTETTTTFEIPEPLVSSPDLGMRGGGCGCGSTDGSAGLVLSALAMLAFAARRRSRWVMRAAAPLALVALVAGSTPAVAQARVAGFDLERIDLNPGASASLITGTGDLMRKGAWRASLVLHYQHDPLVLYRTDTGDRLGAVVGSRFTTHLVGGWTPLDWLEVGVQVPIVVWQGGDDLTQWRVPAPVATALGTPWITGRFGLLRERAGAPLDVSLQLGIGLPFGTAAAYTNATPVAVAPRLGAGKTLLPWLRLGGELGFVLRGSPGASTVTVNGTASTFTAAMSATTIGPKLRGELTLRGAIGLDQAQAGGELLLGLRYPLGKWVEVFALGGPGLGALPGNPAFRLMAGLAVAPPLETEPSLPAQAAQPAQPVCDASVSDEVLRSDCPTLDLDGDGITNAADRCVRVPGVAKAQGCPLVDTDRDGLTDDVDACPKEAGPKERKGCPLKDTDKDGVADEVDACPAEPGPVERKGCPLKDQDGDTVEDALDNCPTVTGTVENSGCPAKQRQLVVITADKLVIRESVYFATGKSVVLPRSNKLLDNVAEVLNAHPEVPLIRIEGHTDSQGKRENNVKLSQARADAVKAALVKRKVGPERLKAVGFGPDQPKESNDTAAGREQNRRVEFNFEAVKP
ncbi:MAG: Ig-like domain-containing protein [Archangium sp.]|nr:Ig-like domain-containing protein [Archangium sp.]